jgi:hypothetical protein
MRLWLPAAAVIVSAGLALSVYGISTPTHVQPPVSAARGIARADKAVAPTSPPTSSTPRPTSSTSRRTSSTSTITSRLVVRHVPPHPPVHKVVTSAKESVSAPARLALPSLGISSPLGPARGLNPDGTVNDAPLTGPTWSLPWWYDVGPSPGQTGSAVILGHVDSALGGLGVFFRLGDLRTGQGVDVTLANGTTTHWTVTSVHLYANAVFPDALVYARTGPPALRLVTCGGAFDGSTHEYESTLVVTAALDG